MTALSLCVVGIGPSAIVEHTPERIAIDHSQIGDNGNENILHTFLVKRSREVMMIDNVVALVGSQHHRNHMLAEQLGLLFRRFMSAPAMAFFFHLAHPHGHLCCRSERIGMGCRTGSRVLVFVITPERDLQKTRPIWMATMARCPEIREPQPDT